MGRDSCCMAATGALALEAVTRNCGGGRSSLSPWLAHTVMHVCGSNPWNSPPARFPDHHLGAAVFPLARRAHRAAHQVRDQLHPVANAQHGHAERQELRVRGRGAGIEYRVRSAGEDDPLRVELPDEREIGAARGGVDLAIHVRLAYAARDQLRELGAVVEDQDLVHDPPWYQVVGSSTSPRSRSSSVSRWRAT